jgi:hypothetical protein
MGDTLLCTTISGVHDRYQARVAWLVVMAAVLCLFRKAEGATISRAGHGERKSGW